jgi:hypothetical protein
MGFSAALLLFCSAGLLFCCSTALLLYRYAICVVFVAATFMVAKIRRLSDLRLHSAALLLYCSAAPFTFHFSGFTPSRFTLFFTDDGQQTRVTDNASPLTD